MCLIVLLLLFMGAACVPDSHSRLLGRKTPQVEYSEAQRTTREERISSRDFGAVNRVGLECGPNEVSYVDGGCVQPQISHNVFLFTAPEIEVSYGPPSSVPKPKVHYNIVFVHSPGVVEGVKPIVVPPPVEKTVVYVLSKNGQIEQQVIEVPKPETRAPEVFFVNYDEGDNPKLPGGIFLQEVLSSPLLQDGALVEQGKTDVSAGYGREIGGRGDRGGVEGVDGRDRNFRGNKFNTKKRNRFKKSNSETTKQIKNEK